MTPILTAFTLFVTISAAFLFSGMEAGMLALNPLKLHRSARMGKKSSLRLLKYLENPEMFLWTSLIGGTTSNFISVCVITLTACQWVDHIAYFLMVLLIGLIGLYVLGDLIPKTLFRKKPLQCCSIGLPIFRVAYITLYPLIKVTIFTVSVLFWKRSNVSYDKRILANRVELRKMMKNYDPDITREERSMIEGVMDFFDMTVKDLLVPMDKVKQLPNHATMKDARELCKKSGFTRIPVYQVYPHGLRRTLGILSMKRVLYLDDVDDEKAVVDLIILPIFLRPDMHLRDALSKMQWSGQRMAIVLDNDGMEMGIVTLQDILVAIFGKLNL